MKIVLFLIAVVVLLWLLKGGTGRRAGARRSGNPQVDDPQPMLACAYCGLHLPRDDALPGRGGVFCGEAHRVAHERAQADDA